MAGTSLIPAYSIPILVGNLVGRVLGRVFGAEVWERSKYVLAAGILSGEAIVIGLSAAALMLAKSTWILPF